MELFAYTKEILSKAEAVADHGADPAKILNVLRELPLDDFGSLFVSLPNPAFPHMSERLPRMASVDAQRTWNGVDGNELLKKTLSFTHIVSHNLSEACGRSLAGARILDFGCGYGRILRTMYYFTDPANLYGCDPWDQSIDLCQESGIIGHLAISDWLPESLPFDGQFDLIYSYSVFTHLSKRATQLCLNTLIEAVRPDGMLVITIRPVEYWNVDQDISEDARVHLTSAHNDVGFAFAPQHHRAPIDGDITYGDTSMTFDYIERNFPKVRVAKIERTLIDPYQILVFLIPV